MGPELTELLESQVLGNSTLRWSAAIVAFCVGFVALRTLRNVLGRRLSEFAKKTDTQADDMLADLLARTRTLFLLVAAARLAAALIVIPTGWEHVVRHATLLAMLYQGGVWSNGLVLFWVGRLSQARNDEDGPRTAMMTVLGVIARVVVWSVFVLLALQNLGVEVTALLAGMGVGGVAVALAVQNVLGDLLASLSIILDHPFTVGDSIAVDSLAGTVEHIGLKTTRVRSLTGEELIFGNADLLKSRIRNYKRMTERRVLFTVGITYQTPVAKVEAVPAMMRSVVEAVPGARFDRAHFKSLGDWALVFEVAFFVTSADYLVYLDAQQAINLGICRRFEAEGIEFAYPTRTVHVTRGIGA